MHAANLYKPDGSSDVKTMAHKQICVVLKRPSNTFADLSVDVCRRGRCKVDGGTLFLENSNIGFCLGCGFFTTTLLKIPVLAF